MNDEEKAKATEIEASLQDSAVDALVFDFLSKNEDFMLDIVIRWEDDLGLKVVLMSGDDSVARSGHATSVTEGLRKLIAKGVPKIAEQREYKAKIEKAFADDLAADDEDD